VRRAKRSRRIAALTREVYSRGLARPFWGDLYHFAMTVSWLQLIAALATFFVSVNVVFGTLYAAVPGSIANQNPPGFLGAFFFSLETLATVGYGDMHPQTLYGHVVASVEIFLGTLSIALLTGVMFARFSRPKSRILFARHPVISPFDGRMTLTIRLANARQNVIVDASARLRIIRLEYTLEGQELRRIHDLALLRDSHPMLLLGWNVMHVIDASSVLASATAASLAAERALFVLTVQGTDETTGQTMMARAVFDHAQLRWNHVYVDVLSDKEGVVNIDYTRFHDTVPLA
jgi:inward rectifier potassium channel